MCEGVCDGDVVCDGGVGDGMCDDDEMDTNPKIADPCV